MEQVIDTFLTFVNEYPLLVLGIMALGVVYLLLDIGLTLSCPADGTPMKQLDGSTYKCGKCGFVKRV